MSKPLPDFRAAIFDMDGLVLDSEPSYIFAWRQAAWELGTRLDEEFLQSLLGRHANDVEHALTEKLGGTPCYRRFCVLASQYWRTLVEERGIPPMPGLRELLALLDRERIAYALATNSDGPVACECLRMGGVDASFPLRVTRDEVNAGKPEPDLFLEAARRLGVPVAKCLVLEDSSTGLLAAKRAGAIPVLVNARKVGEDAQKLTAFTFSSLHEVAKAIQQNLP